MEKTFIEKMVAIQSELKAPKDLYNSFGKYKYRSAESILEAVKPLLKVHGLIVNITDDMVLLGDRFYVKATATITDGVDSVSTTAFAREEENKKGADQSQVTGATSSYARKYALNGLLCIDDNKDSDATNNGDSQPPVEGMVWNGTQWIRPTQMSNNRDRMLALAVAEANQIKSREDLTAVWNKWADFQREEEFCSVCKIKGEQYPKTNKKK